MCPCAIDAFNHFNRSAITTPPNRPPARRTSASGCVAFRFYDLDLQLKVVDQFPDYTQVLSLGMPMVDPGCGA
jgi:hypothetical protein